MTPSRIGKYEIQRRLGGGGMGSLYLARDPGLERLIAIKTLRDEYHDDPDLRERFTREARSVARLRHPNIIIVFEIGEFEGQPFIAMEYIAGDTLTSVLRRQPPLPLPRRVGLIEELCLGLAHAHGAGIIHRDIKPANIMLDGDGVLKILDFGIARHGDSAMTQDGMMMGTVNYMSPEQVVGRGVDHRSDIFAAGAVLYELIALEQAFPGRIDSGVLQRILSDGPIPLEERVPGLDPELGRIVRHALEREPERRYQDVNVMRRDLARVRRRLARPQASDAATELPTTERPREETPGDSRRSDSDRPRRLNPERVAELQRQQVDEYLRFAQEAFTRGDHDAALQHAERAASVDPDSPAAFDLIDKARFAIEGKAIRQLLAEAQRLISDGQVDDAAALADEASVTLSDIDGGVELQAEVRRTVEQIAAAREREQRISASLERARSSIESGGYETALRAVYEVLALDPEQAEARAIEQQAQSQLQAQRHHERARHDAYEQLKRARALADDGRFDAAAAAVNAVSAPSDTVRLAAAEVLGIVEKARRQSAHAAVIVQARAAFAHEDCASALAAIDSIPAEDQTPDVRTLRAAVEEALRAQRGAVEERRQQETRDRLAAGRVEAARQRQEEESRRRAEQDAARQLAAHQRIEEQVRRSPEIERERAREEPVPQREERHADRRVHVAAVAVLGVALGWGIWQFGGVSRRDDVAVSPDSADEQAIRERQTQEPAERDSATEQLEIAPLTTDQADSERLATDRGERERLAREQAEREKLARDQVARDQAAKDQAARDQAARDQAARDEAARDQAARDQAERDQALRDQALRDQAAEDRASIDRLLDEYVNAYARMDESQLKAIDPGFRGIPRRDLIRSVVLAISRRTVTIGPEGQSAVLIAYGEYRYVWERAVLPPSSAAQLTWRLRKVGNNWVVVP